jgi:3D (Asp-Asp-Asp) domain-containing protein
MKNMVKSMNKRHFSYVNLFIVFILLLNCVSIATQRDAYDSTIQDIGEEDKEIVVLSQKYEKAMLIKVKNEEEVVIEAPVQDEETENIIVEDNVDTIVEEEIQTIDYAQQSKKAEEFVLDLFKKYAEGTNRIAESIENERIRAEEKKAKLEEIQKKAEEEAKKAEEEAKKEEELLKIQEQEGTENIIVKTGRPTEYKSVMTVKATAYCLCKKCCGKSPSSPVYGVTASGLKIIPGIGMKVIAVDPKVIKLGTNVYVEGLNGVEDYGYAIAADTGGAIKNMKIDLYFDSHADTIKWGVRNVKLYIL